MPSIPGQEHQQWPQYSGYDYSSYYAAWQNYHSQNPYYNYDQSYANYGSAYQYPAATAAAQPQQQYASYTQQAAQYPVQQTTQSQTSQPAAEQQQTSSSQYYAASYDAVENIIEEHEVPLKVEQLNEELMNKNEELYDALDESRWLPIDGLDPPLIKLK